MKMFCAVLAMLLLMNTGICQDAVPKEIKDMSEDQLESRIASINNGDTGNLLLLPSAVSSVYAPKEGWSYTHHAQIALFQDKLYVTFSQGNKNEDDCGQRVMLSVSEDHTTWSTPQPLCDSMMGEDSLRVLVNGGLYATQDRLVAYYFGYEYRKASLRGENLRPLEDAYRYNHAVYVISTTDGVHWTEPSRIITSACVNHSPEALRSGRLLMCGSEVFMISDEPSGLTGWRTKRTYADAALAEGAKLICEGSFFQTDDEAIFMMLRSNTEYLYCAVSTNNGDTWTRPYKTAFTDCGTKFKFGRLPDGRYYYVGSPIPKSGRNPLVLSLSEDGITFDKNYILRNEPYTQQFEGMYKGGVYGYPAVALVDDTLYVVYSKHKEAIEVTAIRLTDL
jgi:hypothetical protein